MIVSKLELDSFRKRLTRAGFYKIHIVNLGSKGVFLSCFDLYGDFHYQMIDPNDVCLLPKSIISLEV